VHVAVKEIVAMKVLVNVTVTMDPSPGAPLVVILIAVEGVVSIEEIAGITDLGYVVCPANMELVAGETVGVEMVNVELAGASMVGIDM